jgi:hypothetical protein
MEVRSMMTYNRLGVTLACILTVTQKQRLEKVEDVTITKTTVATTTLQNDSCKRTKNSMIPRRV